MHDFFLLSKKQIVAVVGQSSSQLYSLVKKQVLLYVYSRIVLTTKKKDAK